MNAGPFNGGADNPAWPGQGFSGPNEGTSEAASQCLGNHGRKLGAKPTREGKWWILHTVVSTDDPKTFKSKVLDTDEKFSFTFSKAGTYPYFCSIHPKMTGKVIVP